MIYYTKIHFDKKDNRYWTEFPDLEAPGSEGATLKEALENSKEALEGILESSFDRECNIPLPKERKGKGHYPIRIDISIATPILLRKLRLEHKLTLKQLAKKLGISYQSYQILETPRKSNPTVKTLDKILEIYDLDLKFSELLKEAA